jgi:hypothetical protein
MSWREGSSQRRKEPLQSPSYDFYISRQDLTQLSAQSRMAGPAFDLGLDTK